MEFVLIRLFAALAGVAIGGVALVFVTTLGFVVLSAFGVVAHPL